MKKYAAAIVFFLLVSAGQMAAEVINYQGRLKVEGVPFNGVGRFKFALIDERGATLWASQEITLAVSDGIYAARLGDSSQAPPLNTSGLQRANPPRLRISFDRGTKGWSVVGPDVTLSSENATVQINRNPGQNDEVLVELRALRTLVESRLGSAPAGPEPPKVVTVSIANEPMLGDPKASVVLVEFTDFECPFCAKFQNEVFTQLRAAYVDTGKLRVVSRNLPLPFHKSAEPAARAAVCAQAQAKFWEMRQQLFAVGSTLGAEAILKAAELVKLDLPLFNACTATPETTAALARDQQDAKAAGIEATPSFVLGKLDGDKVTGVQIIGAQPFANFDAEIKRLLPAGG